MADGLDRNGQPNNPTKHRAQKGWSRARRTTHNKAKFLEFVRDGNTYAVAAKMLGLKPGIEKYYVKTDPQFKIDLELARSMRDGTRRSVIAKGEALDFREFSSKYLHQDLFNHQLQWWDLLEGREPRNMHEAQRYEPGNEKRLVINTPPEHAKSTTITQNYVAYRICMDPTVRVIIISRTQPMAAKFIRGVKERLTSRLYEDLIRDYAPAEGFNKGNATWTATRVYVNTEGILDEIEDPEELRKQTVEKDPTMEALGIGGQIYGARADLIILDDVIDTENVGQVEKQIEWLQKMVITRLGDFGQCLIVGTRINSVDFYSEVMNDARYPQEKSPWTYLTQPAVLEFDPDPINWTTLWPKSNQPKAGDMRPPGPDGLYPAWDGPSLAKRRSELDPKTWAMVYQQQQVDEEAVFKAEDVMGCVNNARMPGYLHDVHDGGGNDKGDDWRIIAGLDPAMAGFTSIVVYGVNLRTRQRRIVEVINERMKPARMNQLIKDTTEKYRVDEWRVEGNAFQQYLTQSPELRAFMATRGVQWNEHTTGRNKWDSDFGVAAMAMLFLGWEDKNNLIELPAKRNEGVRALIEQLIAWAPELPKTQKTDCVMALWFAEIRARELTSVLAGGEMYVNDDEFMSSGDYADREVLDIEQHLANQRPAHSRWSFAGYGG